MTAENDFSRFELMLIHRLETLETLTKEQHAAFEDLRVDFVTHKTTINTRVTLVSAIFGGLGFALYGIAWLAVRDENENEPIALSIFAMSA